MITTNDHKRLVNIGTKYTYQLVQPRQISKKQSSKVFKRVINFWSFADESRFSKKKKRLKQKNTNSLHKVAKNLERERFQPLKPTPPTASKIGGPRAMEDLHCHWEIHLFILPEGNLGLDNGRQ